MGSITALGIKDSVLDLETQLAYHLQGNHYPPIPAVMIEPCIEAINAYYDKDYSRRIELPIIDNFQITWKGKTHTYASALVAHAHLEWFIEPNEDYDE